MNRPTCSTCAYYAAALQVCRRYAPRPTTPTIPIEDGDGYAKPVEPAREPDEWCGEHSNFWGHVNSPPAVASNTDELEEHWRKLGVVGKPNITLVRLGIENVEQLMQSLATGELAESNGVGERTLAALKNHAKRLKKKEQETP